MKPLTDDELWTVWNAQGTDEMSRQEAMAFARAIEAAVNAKWAALQQKYADPFTYIIQHLNSSPYNLTKDECVTLIKSLRDRYQEAA